MNRLANCAYVCFVLMPSLASAQGAQTIYKFVDESGRVTYANSPIKGGTKVSLEPLTVIQSSPGATHNNAPAARVIPVAKVTSVPSPSSAISTLPAAFAVAVTAPVAMSEPTVATPIMMAALDTSDKIQERAQQRRADVRQRILQSEIQAEEKSLAAARVALAEEQRRSSEVRTMRASFAATAVAVTPQKPLISPEARAEIERHFERVRNLQDEVTMHDSSIAALRAEQAAQK